MKLKKLITKTLATTASIGMLTSSSVSAINVVEFCTLCGKYAVQTYAMKRIREDIERNLAIAKDAEIATIQAARAAQQKQTALENLRKAILHVRTSIQTDEIFRKMSACEEFKTAIIECKTLGCPVNETLYETFRKGISYKHLMYPIDEQSLYPILNYLIIDDIEADIDAAKKAGEKNVQAAQQKSDIIYNQRIQLKKLQIAALEYEKEAIDLIQKNIGNLDSIFSKDDHSTALHSAVLFGSYRIVGALLEYGANINIKDEHGDTPLHIAVNSGRNDIVKLLISYPEINLNLQNKNGDTPLHIAVNSCRDDIAKLLISCPEINLNLQNKNGDTPLHIATKNYVERRQSHDLIDFLIQKGASYLIKNNFGFTPMRIIPTNLSSRLSSRL